MSERNDLQKGLLYAGLGALTLGVLISVMLFLFGKFGETQARLLMTTFVVGWYSLAASMSFGLDKNLKQVGIGVTFLSVGACAAGALWTLRLVWLDEGQWFGERMEGDIKTAVVLFIVSWMFAHSAMLLKTIAASTLHSAIVFCSVALVVLSCFMLVNLVLTDFKGVTEGFVRLLAAISVLAVGGTIGAPIVKKLAGSSVQPGS